MKKPFHILLVLAAAMMLLASSCACADITEGLIYDDTDNTWAAGDEDLTELISIMKRECTKSSLIKGAYTKVFRSAPLTPNWSSMFSVFDAFGDRCCRSRVAGQISGRIPSSNQILKVIAPVSGTSNRNPQYSRCLISSGISMFLYRLTS